MLWQIIVFLTIIVSGIFLFFTCHIPLDINTFDSGKPGKHVLLIGGTHGDEPAGSYALLVLQNLIKKGILKLKKGKITIIHNVNPCGLYFDNRYYSVIGKKIDLNRMYGKGFAINRKIEEIIPKSDLIIDFHEGWGYMIRKEGSIGSSITYLNIPFKEKYKIINKLNSKVTDPTKKWIVNDIKLEVPHSLRELAMVNKKSYMLVETTGQKNVQPMHIRIRQSNTIITHFLKLYGIL